MNTSLSRRLEISLLLIFSGVVSCVAVFGQAPAYFQERELALPYTTTGIREIEFGDVDNDGDLDLAMVGSDTNPSADNPSRLLINQGPDGFVFGGILGDITDICLDFEFGDLDGDGDLDGVMANGFPGIVAQAPTVLLNDGTGSFTESRFFPDAPLAAMGSSWAISTTTVGWTW